MGVQIRFNTVLVEQLVVHKYGIDRFQASSPNVIVENAIVEHKCFVGALAQVGEKRTGISVANDTFFPEAINGFGIVADHGAVIDIEDSARSEERRVGKEWRPQRSLW